MLARIKENKDLYTQIENLAKIFKQIVVDKLNRGKLLENEVKFLETLNIICARLINQLNYSESAENSIYHAFVSLKSKLLCEDNPWIPGAEEIAAICTSFKAYKLFKNINWLIKGKIATQENIIKLDNNFKFLEKVFKVIEVNAKANNDINVVQAVFDFIIKQKSLIYIFAVSNLDYFETKNKLAHVTPEKINPDTLFQIDKSDLRLLKSLYKSINKKDFAMNYADNRGLFQKFDKRIFKLPQKNSKVNLNEAQLLHVCMLVLQARKEHIRKTGFMGGAPEGWTEPPPSPTKVEISKKANALGLRIFGEERFNALQIIDARAAITVGSIRTLFSIEARFAKNVANAMPILLNTPSDDNNKLYWVPTKTDYQLIIDNADYNEKIVNNIAHNIVNLAAFNLLDHELNLTKLKPHILKSEFQCVRLSHRTDFQPEFRQALFNKIIDTLDLQKRNAERSAPSVLGVFGIKSNELYSDDTLDEKTENTLTN